ncbi:MAG TPA: YheC/YheD family protein [Bacillales bacterium]|nr:YheC/YheD family protein [Bacillales bacterium]
MHHPLKLRKTDQSTGTVTLPEAMRSHIKEPISWLVFSARRTPCRLTFSGTAGILYVSADLWEALHLPHETTVHLFIKENALHLGPLIGIFSAGFTDDPVRPVGERTLFFAKFLSVAEEVGAFCCVFGCHHLHWETGTMDAFFYRENGWEQIRVPFPDVIYDRLPNRKTERLPRFQKVKQILREDYLIPWFNPGFFDKWKIHELLQADERAKPYLPETYRAPTVERIENMLETHGHIYLKPANGSLGLGIHQIIKPWDEKGYYCRYHDETENRLRRFESLPSLIRQQLPQGRLDHLLVQEGIELLKWQSRSVDFRIHTNKNENGEWLISTVAAKVAGHGSVTTHIKYGGEVKMIEEVLGHGPRKTMALEKLKEAALTISHIIDTEIEDTVGEIGFDLGLDRDGHIWLFEANAKPGRHIFIHPKLKEADEKSRKLPLAYAVHLAEEAITQPAVIYA